MFILLRSRLAFTTLLWVNALLVLFAVPQSTTNAQDEACQPGVDYVEIGDSAFDSGDYGNAINAYGCALQSDPENDYLLRRQAEADLYGPFMGYFMGNFRQLERINPKTFDHIIADQTQAIDSDPVNLNAYLLRGATYVWRGLFMWSRNYDAAIPNFELALPDLEKVSQLDASNTAVCVFRGEANFVLHNFAARDEDLTCALEAYPTNVEVYLLASEAWMHETDRVLPLLDQAVALAPDNAEVYAFRAFVNEYVVGAYSLALEDFDHALELDPDNLLALTERGYLYYRFLGDWDKALDDFDRALTIDPNHLYAREGRMRLYWQQGNLDLAIADATEYIKSDPDNFAGWYYRGFLYTEAGEIGRAASDYLRHIELKMTDTIAVEAFPVGTTMVFEMAQYRVFQIPLEVEVDDLITVRVVSVEQYAVDPLVVLVNASNVPVFVNDDTSSDDPNSLIEDYRVLEAGTYTILITYSFISSDGDIQVTVNVSH